MNSIIVLPQDCVSPQEALLTGERARLLIKRHDLKQGLDCAAAVLGGKRGRATVLELSETRLRLGLELNTDPPAREPTELIVAVARPQTVKKILQTAASLGLRRVHFIRSERSVKSYLQSKVLSADNIQQELIEGLEQSCDSILPEVMIHQRFLRFIEDYLTPRITSGENKPKLFCADTRAEPALSLARLTLDCATQPVFLAIGPEAGWSEFEVSRFKACGFQLITLGERMLRVEIASTVLLAQLSLLRQQV